MANGKPGSAGNVTAEETSQPYGTTSGIIKKSWQSVPLGEYFGRPSTNSPARTECKLCGRSFKTAAGIVRHMKGHGLNVYGNIRTVGGDR